jgi:hypothetical protein
MGHPKDQADRAPRIPTLRFLENKLADVSGHLWDVVHLGGMSQLRQQDTTDEDLTPCFTGTLSTH